MEALKTYKSKKTPVFFGHEPEADWDSSECSCNAIPKSLAEVKDQIRISEEQIKNGRYVTAKAAIAHFMQL